MVAVTLGPGQIHPDRYSKSLPRLLGRKARLVHQPAALVGPGIPICITSGEDDADLRQGFRCPRRPCVEAFRKLLAADLSETTGPSTKSAGSSRADRAIRSGTPTSSTTFVQLGALAISDTVLAEEPRNERYLPDERPLDRPATSSASGWRGCLFVLFNLNGRPIPAIPSSHP